MPLAWFSLALLSCDFFDITPPDIKFISPSTDTEYFGTIPVELKATDNRGVDKVELFLDGESIYEFSKGPYKTDIDLSQINASTVTLKAVAYDKADNHAEASRDVTLTIGLRLTSPNGGEAWPEHSTQLVTWESSGNVGSSISLDYSLDGGNNWDGIIASTPNSGSYSWTIPNFIETEPACKIKVSTSGHNDVSDSAFTINAEPNSLTLTSPNGGEVWAEQSTHNITWTSGGDVGGTLSLHYSLDGGTTWAQISTTPNDGSHPWTLPNLLESATNCQIKIASTTTAFGDSSDADFTISAEANFIALTSPNGGETWAEQSTQTITWSYSGDVGDYVDLAFSVDEGTSWQTIEAYTENDGLYSWVLPNFPETSTTCRVKVASTTTSFADTSESDFTITAEPNYLNLTSPIGGEVWDEQTSLSITWAYSGDVGNSVNLGYSLDEGATWTQFAAAIPVGNQQHTWNLPNLSETNSTCRLRVQSTSTAYGDTSANFTIVAEPNYISLVSPDGGEIWAEQTTHSITWNYSGDVDYYVNLDYSLDGGVIWTQIAAAIPIEDQQSSWSLPNLTETMVSCRVRVLSTTTIYGDTSAANFTITGGEITITAPDGGEDWREWSDQTITWTSSGDVGTNVSLHYSIDGGITWIEITASTANNGSYSWTLPAIAETQTTCQMKVSSTTTDYYDFSDADFTMTNWAPILLGSSPTLHFSYGVYVIGGLAYVADNNYLQIIDVTDPQNPTLVGSAIEPPEEAANIFVSGNYAYIADTYSSLGLIIMDVADAANPTFAGSFRTPDGHNDIYVSGNYAYIAADSDGGLQIVDITNPANPVFSGSYITPGGPEGVYVAGSYAYIADGTSGGLQIIDISDPANPTPAGSNLEPGNAISVFVADSYAYVVDNDLQIINVSNPAQPTFAGSYTTPGLSKKVFVSGNYAYVADRSYGLQVLNISNPVSITLAGFYDTPSFAYGVFLVGDYAYVANGTSGLLIFDISGLP